LGQASVLSARRAKAKGAGKKKKRAIRLTTKRTFKLKREGGGKVSSKKGAREGTKSHREKGSKASLSPIPRKGEESRRFKRNLGGVERQRGRKNMKEDYVSLDYCPRMEKQSTDPFTTRKKQVGPALWTKTRSAGTSYDYSCKN